MKIDIFFDETFSLTYGYLGQLWSISSTETYTLYITDMFSLTKKIRFLI